MRRAAWILALSGMAAASACGFPDLTYETTSTEGGPGATDDAGAAADSADELSPGQEASADDRRDPPKDSPSGSTTDGAGPDANGTPDTGADAVDEPPEMDAVADVSPTPPDDATADAPVDMPETSPPVDAAADATHDSGGVNCDQDNDGYEAAGGTCGGNDCCDTDSNAHPGQTQFFPTTDACGSFDYNCDNKLETEYAVNVTCSGTGLTGCSGGPGFTSSPACGTSAAYSMCQGSGILSCAPVSSQMVVQGCN